MIRSGYPLQSKIVLSFVACLFLCTANLQASERQMPDGYITGKVTSDKGAEAGVWVIAETHETDTPFTKIVVTDDKGRYVLPELPLATYRVWVRGYGLVDSDAVEGRPGDRDLNLEAIIASSELEAAQYYPPDYWLSLFEPPKAGEFPGTGPEGNGIGENLKSQRDWLHQFKSGCHFCHQLGNKVTRSLEHMDHLNLGTSQEKWDYRTQLGVRGGNMYSTFVAMGREKNMQVFADWTDRIAAGELPPKPARPQGIERNVVVTLRDLGFADSYMHDEITTDKNNPSVNAYGLTYAVSSGHGRLSIVDPVENTFREIIIPTREDPRTVSTRFPPPGRPSNFWGMEYLWGPEHPSDPHNPMIDPQGRVWITSKIRNDQPDWCGEKSKHKYAQYYPLNFSPRQVSVYDPVSNTFELIDTCFGTHHLQFSVDADNTVYFNELLGPMFGWINTKVWDQTKDEQAAQGWCPQIIDTNGDGKITKPWNKFGGELDPKRDSEVRYNLYSIIPSPVDTNIIWGASETFPGHIVRLNRGDNPPETCMAEVYRVPKPGFDPRGIDIDSEGIPWVALAGSSHFASFERSKCKVTKGMETLEGEHCNEGWTFYETDGPNLKGTSVPADFHYFGWVDQHNVIGLGKDTPILTGSNSDSLLALDPKTGKWTRLRVPYPMGFYHRGLDGRIDDATTWKGRSLWANYGTHLMWHVEGGKGQVGKMVQFQIRPDPLAH